MDEFFSSLIVSVTVPNVKESSSVYLRYSFDQTYKYFVVLKMNECREIVNKECELDWFTVKPLKSKNTTGYVCDVVCI